MVAGYASLMPRIVVTFGTYDLFHVGHLNLLRRAAALGDQLIVGVSSDELNYSKKQKHATFSVQERVEIIGALRCVDHVFIEYSLEQKREYLNKYGADVLVMGDDWAGKFNHFSDMCEVIYLQRTPEVSTTSIVKSITTQAPSASHT
tara:strand:+ start:104 stop:544 length:441 start_codon:yes stop_codon:yes gene_type:complete